MQIHRYERKETFHSLEDESGYQFHICSLRSRFSNKNGICIKDPSNTTEVCYTPNKSFANQFQLAAESGYGKIKLHSGWYTGFTFTELEFKGVENGHTNCTAVTQGLLSGTNPYIELTLKTNDLVSFSNALQKYL